MCVVNSWQNAPAAVDLRVVFVDLRDDEEHRCKKQRERQGSNQRVRGEIYSL